MNGFPRFEKSRALAAFAGVFVMVASARAAAPTGILLNPAVAKENLPPGSVIGTLSAVDTDIADYHYFFFSEGTGSGDNGGFSISGNQLIVPYGVPLDYEDPAQRRDLKIRLGVIDSTGLWAAQEFSIPLVDDRTEDVDADGLTEQEEEDMHGTSDLTFDTDGDGVGDGAEVHASPPTSPTNATQWPASSIVGWGDSSEGERAAPVGGGVIALATGQNHSLSLNAAGNVTAWGGMGTYGQTAVPPGLQNVIAVAAGGDYWLKDSAHSVALKSDGTVVGWGYDHDGRIVVPSGLNNVVDISAGRSHCLALRNDGSVVAWGYNPHGAIDPPPGLTGVVAVSAGGFHSLALKSDGRVVAWGSQFDGEKWIDASVPAGLSDVVAVSAGRFHNLALKSDGTVFAWGYNSHGQTNVPTGLANVVAVSAGGFHSLALKSDGTVAAWGLGDKGQTTVPPAAQGDVKLISAGIFHSLAVRQSAAYPAITSLPRITTGAGDPVNHAVTVANAVPVSFAATGLPPGLGIDAQTGVISGTVSSAARAVVRINVQTDQGLLTQSAWIAVSSGSAPTSITLSPAAVVENSAAGAVVGTLTASDPDAGDVHTFELVDGAGAADNALFRISGGQLIVNETITRDYERNPAGFSIRIRATDASLNNREEIIALQFTDDRAEDADGDGLTELLEEEFLFMSDSDPDMDDDGFRDGFEIARGSDPKLATSFPEGRMVMTWGSASDGKALLPAGMEDVVDLSAGGGHSLALKSDGTVLAWGADADGQTDVPYGLSGVTAVEAGDRHSLVLKNDGTVAAWGANDMGQTAVPEGLSGVVAISAGGYHNLALKSDGTVTAWGGNAYFQSEVPAGLTDVVAVAAGGFHSMALKSDGTVVAWGSDWDGVSTVPAGLGGVVAIAAGGYHCMALKHDGTLVAWGTDAEGQSSVPEGLHNVTAISAGWLHSMALKADGTLAAWGDDSHHQCGIPPEAAHIRKIEAGDFHNLAIRQNAGFPAFENTAPLRAWPGATVARVMTVQNAVPSSFSAMGLPPGLAIDSASGLLGGTVLSGERRAARISAVTDQTTLSRVIWVNTADGSAPSDVALSSTSVMENSPAGTLVGFLSATDPDAGDVHSFDLAYVADAPDSYRFMVSGNQLLTRYPLSADYDAGITQLSIRVVVVDSANNTLEKNFLLQVADDRTEDADGDGLNEAVEEDVLGSSDAVFDDFNSSDADHDGIAGLLEYAFNLNPKSAGPPLKIVPGASSTAGLPAVSLVPDGQGGRHLRIEYLRRIGAGLAYTPEFSSGTTWSAATQAVTVTPIDSNWERCIVDDTQSTSRRFGRVKVAW